MGRRLAYMLVALIGFSIGVILYIIGVFLIPFLIQILPQLEITFTEYRYVLGALASGFIGSIIAVIIAYIWASRSEF